jgi:hypothetical protein
MNMTKLYSILLSLLITTSAWAVSGTGVSSGGPETGCRVLVLSHQTKEILGLCSGTLTGESEVSTAGHCVLGRSLKYFDYQVDCGYSGFKASEAKKTTLEGGFSFYSKGPIFRETHSVSAVQISKEFGTTFKGNDAAKLTLAKASVLTPTAIASTSDIKALYFDSAGHLRENVNCMISGYGESNGEIAGKLNHAGLTADSRILDLSNRLQFAISFVQPPPDELADITALLTKPYYWLDAAYFETFVDLSLRAALTEAPGDSGSGLYCQKDSTSAWRMIGIDSSVAVGISAEDPGKIELLDTFGLPETEYIPLK